MKHLAALCYEPRLSVITGLGSSSTRLWCGIFLTAVPFPKSGATGLGAARRGEEVGMVPFSPLLERPFGRTFSSTPSQFSTAMGFCSSPLFRPPQTQAAVTRAGLLLAATGQRVRRRAQLRGPGREGGRGRAPCSGW